MTIKTHIVYTILRLFNLRHFTSKMFLKPTRSKTFNFPNRLKKYGTKHSRIDRTNIVTFNINSQSNKHIIFFHGGAYSAEAIRGHWWMVKQLMDKTKFKLTFVDYPLNPEQTAKQIHIAVENVYIKLVENNPNDVFYFVGDSAGGGLSLSLSQTLRDKKHSTLPKKIALLSPWLDVTMTNPDIKPLEKKDLVLSRDTLITIGKRFAGDLPTTDSLVSPLNGDCNNLNKISVFIGKSELFLPDCQLLKRKIEKSNTELFYKEYAGMIHDWWLFPIPEKKILINDLCEYLLRD